MSNWEQQFVESFIAKLVNPREKHRLEQVSELGYKVIDTSTNECLWDIRNGGNVFTLEEAEQFMKEQNNG
jgi:hypothetical protein